MWELDAQQNCSVEYGMTTQYGNSAGASSEIIQAGSAAYKSFLTGLSAGTQYHYRLVIDGTPQDDKTFKTAPKGYTDFTFGVWGDSQGHNHGAYPNDPYEPTKAMITHMADRVDFGVSVGDLAENGNSYNDTRVYYLDRVAQLLGTKVPWFNAWGNHDSSSGAIIRKFADMPSKQRGAPYHSGYGNFSFTYGNCHFLCIDDLERTNFEWIKNDLYSAHKTSKFIFVFVHRPPYCERWYSGEQVFRDELVPLLELYGADVCFSGHTHAYARGYKNGVYYCVTGGGSWLDSHEPLTTDWPHLTVGGYHDLAPGVNGGLVNEYVAVNVTKNSFTVEMTAFNPDGSVMAGVTDSFSKSELMGDINGDRKIDIYDLAIMTSGWLTNLQNDPTRAVIPDLDGMNEEDAKSAIIEAELFVDDVTYTYMDGTATGTVISQQPAAGTKVDISTGVDITVAYGSLIYSENFDGLNLGPNVHEWLTNQHAFTHAPPTGWSIDKSGVPTINDPGKGVYEWEGWSFTDPQWWNDTAGDQQRSQFTRASGIIAVADPDEWDDRGTNPKPEEMGTYKTFLSTPAISLTNAVENTAMLIFDSSWRPEDYQKAVITVSYDGAAAAEIMTWTSTSGPNYKSDATNETVNIPLNNPADAQNIVITFGLIDAGNDWWWAIDNLKISAMVEDN